MLNKRLMGVASFVEKGDIPLDVGTDHGYLPIYLRKNKVCKKVLASDISEKALNGARQNAEKYKASEIEFYCTDGLERIPFEYNTLIISGMGTSTIIHILEGKVLPDKLIISSNNDLPMLRSYLGKRGYKIKAEIVVREKGKYYDIICYEKGKEKLTEEAILYGKSGNVEYYNYLLETQKRIYEKINSKNKKEIKNKIQKLEDFIRKMPEN